MGLKEYETEVNGVTTTVLLDDEDAEAQGLSGGKAVDDPPEPQPQSWSLEDDGDDRAKAAAEPETKQQKSTKNK